MAGVFSSGDRMSTGVVLCHFTSVANRIHDDDLYLIVLHCSRLVLFLISKLIILIPDWIASHKVQLCV